MCPACSPLHWQCLPTQAPTERSPALLQPATVHATYSGAWTLVLCLILVNNPGILQMKCVLCHSRDQMIMYGICVLVTMIASILTFHELLCTPCIHVYSHDTSVLITTGWRATILSSLVATQSVAISCSTTVQTFIRKHSLLYVQGRVPSYQYHSGQIYYLKVARCHSNRLAVVHI